MTKIGLNGWFLAKPYTGIGQYTANLLHALAKAQPKVMWVVAVPQTLTMMTSVRRSKGKAKIKRLWPKNVHFIVISEKTWLPIASLRKWAWEQFQVPALFKREKVDLVHYPYPSNPRFPPRYRLKTVVTVHDVIPWVDPDYRQRFRSRFYHAWAQKALLKADQIIAVSQATADALTDLLSSFPLARVCVVHEAAAPEFLQISPRRLIASKSIRSKIRPYFLYVGGYDTRKNVLRLVEAFLEYVALHYKVDLVLVGAKDTQNPHYTTLKKLHSLAECSILSSLKGPRRGLVRFTAPLSIEALADRMRSALALVHPSLSEGFNLPLLEAAACGTPLLVSDIPVHREILGSHGLFFDSTSTKAIGQALLDFLHDPALRDHLKNETKPLTQSYSWDNAAKETLQIYRTLLP